MMDSKMERMQDLCSRKDVLVKLLFAEINFKNNFEGKEERAVTDRERKRIPYLCSRKAVGAIDMLVVVF